MLALGGSYLAPTWLLVPMGRSLHKKDAQGLLWGACDRYVPQAGLGRPVGYSRAPCGRRGGPAGMRAIGPSRTGAGVRAPDTIAVHTRACESAHTERPTRVCAHTHASGVRGECSMRSHTRSQRPVLAAPARAHTHMCVRARGIAHRHTPAVCAPPAVYTGRYDSGADT